MKTLSTTEQWFEVFKTTKAIYFEPQGCQPPQKLANPLNVATHRLAFYVSSSSARTRPWIYLHVAEQRLKPAAAT